MQSTKSLGLKLATTLTAQLDGEIELLIDNGVVVVIRFPLPREHNDDQEGLRGRRHDDNQRGTSGLFTRVPAALS